MHSLCVCSHNINSCISRFYYLSLLLFPVAFKEGRAGELGLPVVLSFATTHPVDFVVVGTLSVIFFSLLFVPFFFLSFFVLLLSLSTYLLHSSCCSHSWHCAKFTKSPFNLVLAAHRSFVCCGAGCYCFLPTCPLFVLLLFVTFSYLLECILITFFFNFFFSNR